MAEITNFGLKMKKRKENENRSCDLIFEGGLQSTTRASMVIELVKYFMYERQQIPLTFDYAKRQLKLCQENESSKVKTPQNSEEARSTRLSLKNRLTMRKATTAIENLEKIFENLEKSFEQCPEINQVMIILGGTIVSPKEVYTINMPPLSPDAEYLPFKSCVKSLFRQLITQDMLGDIKTISPTSMSVLLKAPRNCHIEWFTPNHNFKSPNRGQQFTYNCLCKQPIVHNHDLTHDANEFEISGIDCLDSIDIDMSEIMLEDVSLSELLSRRVSFGHHRRSTHVPSHIENTECEEKVTPLQVEEDSIWFQSPVIVKGYRDPVQKKL